MQQNVDKVVTEDIQSAKTVIDGKAQVSQKSYGGIAKNRPEVPKVADGGIFDNFTQVVEVELAGERVGIDQEPEKKNAEAGG